MKIFVDRETAKVLRRNYRGFFRVEIEKKKETERLKNERKREEKVEEMV